MNVVAITGQSACELVQRPMPRAGADFAVVKVLVAPMCTEFKAYSAGSNTDRLGHEAGGEVVEVAQPGRVKVGDRVVVMPQYPCGVCRLCLNGEYIHCRNLVNPLAITGSEAGTATYAQYLLKQDWLLAPVPPEVSLEHASLACCGLGPTFGAMETLRVDAHDTVLITGLGPVGLGGVINGACRGARVIGVESNPYRARLAKELGADVVVNPEHPDAVRHILDLTDGEGVDAAIDCSGIATGQRLAIDATRRRGKIAFVGEAGDLTVNVSNDLIRKGLTLVGQWHYNRGLVPAMMRMIGDLGPKLDRFITHSFPMSEVQDAFELQLTGQCGKVLLRPWG